MTLTVLTLDGVDVLAQSATTDNRVFVLATSGLALGDHTVKVNGTDEAGNTLTADASAKFTVKEVAPIQIPLKPGQNLVSLPGEPADPAINAVITVANVNTVVTYDPINPDPATGSPWLSATRATVSDPLTGSLTTIDSGHGYWVKISSFDPIKVEIPLCLLCLPPSSTQVVAGWNLVGVVSIEREAPGTTISADRYFAGTDWIRAWTYNPQTDAITQVLPLSFQNVVVGQGYWLEIPQDGLAAPTPTATPTPTPPPTALPIPGLWEWSLVILAGLFGVLLLWRLRRRPAVASKAIAPDASSPEGCCRPRSSTASSA